MLHMRSFRLSHRGLQPKKSFQQVSKVSRNNLLVALWFLKLCRSQNSREELNHIRWILLSSNQLSTAFDSYSTSFQCLFHALFAQGRWHKESPVVGGSDQLGAEGEQLGLLEQPVDRRPGTYWDSCMGSSCQMPEWLDPANALAPHEHYTTQALMAKHLLGKTDVHFLLILSHLCLMQICSVMLYFCRGCWHWQEAFVEQWRGLTSNLEGATWAENCLELLGL